MAEKPFSVINNLQAYSAQNSLFTSKMGLDKGIGRIASGLRILNAGDDAAGLAIGNGLNADFMALSQGTRNANDGVGMVQIADGSMSQFSSMLGRATQLAAQAASDTVGADERKTINAEFQQIMQEIDRVADTTNFKGEKLFSQNGAVTKNIYVGDTQTPSNIQISIAGSQGAGTQALGLKNVNLNSQSSAIDALSKVSDAIQTVSQWQGALGAQQNRLTNSIAISQVQSQNLLAAKSAITDANMAEEVTNITKFRMLMQSGMASMAQSNASSQMILNLFR